MDVVVSSEYPTVFSQSGLPEQGQLVEVRGRQYIVLDLQRDMLPPDIFADALLAPQHVVRMQAVDDDATGDELRVVWEIEPGTSVFEKIALPSPAGFDPPRTYDVFLDAVRWGAITSADVGALQSPFRSGITIEDYQLDPVARAIHMPRAHLLIADDVGLGKTIEAGLVAQELTLRHRVRTILVVCPSSLQLQWHDQLRDKFGLLFRVVDTELLRRLRRERGLHVNPWTHYPRLITSIDFLKREQPMRLLRELLNERDGDPGRPRPFDLLIVDEAHNVAPSGRGRYALDSQRTAAIRTLVPHCEHRLFLSATPHNGYPESFTALLELLDDQRFARGVPPDGRQLAAVMVRRLKSELPARWDGTPRFPQRVLEPLEVGYTDAERETHALLRQYTALRLRHATDATERVAAEFVLKLLKKRLFSSPEAFAITLAKHRESLLTARRAASGVTPPTLGVLRRRIEELDEERDDDSWADEVTSDALATASLLFAAPTEDETALLDALSRWAADARQRPDSKTHTLLRWLETHLRPSGAWSDERVIVFTEYRDTQRWLEGILAARGYTTGNRMLLLYGGMPTDARERVKAHFQAGPELTNARLLLATDAASEGIDLQNHCARLVHFEIPWNPNRMEQRNGRIDRHGQRAAAVRISHFVGEGWQSSGGGEAESLNGDLEFLYRAAEKVEQIRADLGKVGPVIAAQVEEAMLGSRRRLDTAGAERDAEPARRLVRSERVTREQLEKYRRQIDETREALHIAPANIAAVVDTALALAGQSPLRKGAVSAGETRPALAPVYHLPALTGSWAACTAGLAHPLTGEQRPVVFDDALAAGRDDVVLAHLHHPLVQMSVRLLRAEVWAVERGKLHRVTARLVPDPATREPVVIAHARLLLLGRTQARLHEEVIAAGGTLREGRFVRMNVGEVRRVLDAATVTPVSTAIETRLRERWETIEGPLRVALDARGRERGDSLKRLLDERAATETANSATVLEELRASILREIGEPRQLALALFSEDERGQYERDLAGLRARAERIPAEIAREAAAIAARYADPQPRLFPIGVTFLVPESLARTMT